MIKLSHDPYAEAREEMVDRQIVPRGVADVAVLAAMREVPRDLFVLDEHLDHAYDDGPLPIIAGQTISQPYIVAYMTELLKLGPTAGKILEVGTGAGYQAAILAAMGHRVVTVERIDQVAELARQNLAQLPYGDMVDVRVGDGCRGVPEEAPFDAIIITAAAPHIPPALPHQLRLGGRLVMPCGNRRVQEMIQAVRTGPDKVEVRRGIGCRFVPLIGKDAFPEEEGQ